MCPSSICSRTSVRDGAPWIELALATPVVLWGGWPFFAARLESIVHRSLNMFTLIGLGVGVALRSTASSRRSLPASFPPSFRDAHGDVARLLRGRPRSS